MSLCPTPACVRPDGHAGECRPTIHPVRERRCIDCGTAFMGVKARYCRQCSVHAQQQRRSVLLGPAPCQGCRLPVVWNGAVWREPGKRFRHRCTQAAAA
jgi:hypothetical protein